MRSSDLAPPPQALDIVCPRDGAELLWDDAGVTCPSCGGEWDRQGDVPLFAPGEPAPEGNAAATAATAATDADRGPDWRFLFPLETDSRVLLAGFAEDGFAESLAPDVAAVGAIVPVAPPSGSTPDNVVAAVTTVDRLPFRDATFDLVAADPHLLPVDRDARARLLRALLGKLKPGGRLYVPATNRWGRLFPAGGSGRPAAPHPPAGSLGMRGWRRLLERAGFVGVRFHAAFPDARRPRELVPLDDRAALDWWWRNVSRRPRHGIPAAVARLTHRAGLTPRLVPHFAIVARRRHDRGPGTAR